MSSCIFCDIVAGKAPARRVYEDKHTLAFLDLYPISRGHCLVIPKKHVQWFTDIEPQDGVAGPFLKSVYLVARKVKKAFKCRHVTLLLRGTRVPHVHMLIVPSVEGEDNILDKALDFHHYCQARLKPVLSDKELDDAAERIRNAPV